MKKFLAVLFALIFALSATTVAFAGVENLTCDSCFEVLPTLAKYNEHISGGCLVDFEPCQYCKGNIRNENLEAHEANCPKGAGTCEFCGADYGTQAEYAAHKENDCKVTTAIGDKIPVATVVDKIVEVVKGIDWADLGGKVVDAVKGIDIGGLVEKIKPIFEKIVAFVTEALGEAEVAA